MRQIFFSPRVQPLPNWLQAYPEAEFHPYPQGGAPVVDVPGSALVWVHLSGDGGDSMERFKAASLAAPGCRRIVLANVPDMDEGARLLEAGASGYSSSLAVPSVLHQIEAVVENGGLWVGPELMQRLMSALAGLSQRSAPEPVSDRGGFSDREWEVAVAVAKGASNKEVARQLGITERTVKAHLSAVFHRLGVRDRLQLSVRINGIPLSTPSARKP